MKCLFRGKYEKDGKEIYGCLYSNEPNSLRFREDCPHKDVEKCKKFDRKGVCR